MTGVDGGALSPETGDGGTARRLLHVIEVPAGKGRAFTVRQGQVVRIIQSAGPQVVDFNAFSLRDPRERFASGRTRILEGAHLTTGNRLWSTPPRTRPMFRIVRDTVARPSLPHGAAPHDLLYSRCDSGFWKIIRGVDNHPNCR